jgi:hypothetical protein
MRALLATGCPEPDVINLRREEKVQGSEHEALRLELRRQPISVPTLGRERKSDWSTAAEDLCKDVARSGHCLTGRPSRLAMVKGCFIAIF